MFLRKMKNKTNGRIYLSIVHSYRDNETKKTKSKTIKSLGYLDKLQKKYDDPFSLDDLYRCLSFLNKHKDSLQFWMHKRIQDQYGRNTNLVYYDVTNYYFEIDEQDEIRRKGVSKERRPDPIVQMELFMDTDGIPITFGLHPGNILDKQTLIPMLGNVQRNFNLGKTIIVADKGMTTGDNIWYTLSAKNGYILSYSIRCANQKLKDYALDQGGIVPLAKTLKYR